MGEPRLNSSTTCSDENFLFRHTELQQVRGGFGRIVSFKPNLHLHVEVSRVLHLGRRNDRSHVRGVGLGIVNAEVETIRGTVRRPPYGRMVLIIQRHGRKPTTDNYESKVLATSRDRGRREM
jgi:hypothetical protein